MAIKINLMPKKENGPGGGGQKQPFYFSIIFVFFIASALIFIGVYSYGNFFLKKQLDANRVKSARIQEDISKSVSQEDLPAVVSAIVKGENISSILSSHLYGSNIYAFLERVTVKSTIYNKFTYKINADKTINVSLAGEADSFNALAKQLLVFKKSKEIKEIVFDGGSIAKNSKISFSVDLLLSSSLVVTALK